MEANKTAVPNELCQVVVRPSTTHALRGVVNDVQVVVDVITGHSDDTVKRPPINMAIVLDRSGSMDSLQKLSNAKKAIIKVIEALNAEDVLHLVLYGSQVETAFENANPVELREKLIERVKKVRTEGCTNMYAGLEQGAKLVSEHSKSGYTNRIFLFSDGLVNEGITERKEIYSFISNSIHTERNTKVSAFGLGNDFDEELMKGIAEHGSGAYFFIEGSSAIGRFVEFALKGLFKLVGTDATLKLRGLNGAVVTKIFSHDDLTKPFKFDDLKQDDRRRVVCELKVTPSVQLSEDVLKWEVEYRPASNAEETLSSSTVCIQGTTRLYFTDDSADVEKHRNNSVLAQVSVSRTGEIDAHIIELINAGKSAEAIQETEKEIDILRSALEQDEDGGANVAGLLKQAELALADLKREGASKANQKKAHHRAYMKKRLSICYDQEYLQEAVTAAVENDKNGSGSGSDSDSDSDSNSNASAQPKPTGQRRWSLRLS